MKSHQLVIWNPFKLKLWTLTFFASIIFHLTLFGQSTLLVKVSRENVASLERRSLSALGYVTTGIPKLDGIHERYRVTSMKRVFREAGKFEHAHKMYGLHQWYEVRCETKSQTGLIVNDFQQAGYFENVMIKSEYHLIGPVDERKMETMESFSLVNDPMFAQQWHYKNTGQSGGTPGADISLEPAWNISTGSPSVIVAVIDEGVDILHSDLEASMWINPGEIPNNQIDDDNNGYVDDINGYGFADDMSTIFPHSHGTHVAGTIAALNNNGVGVSGIAGGKGMPGVKIMSLASFGHFVSSGGFDEAMVYAADNGAAISQNSWHGPGIFDAIDYFKERAGFDNSNKNFDQSIQTGPMRGGIVIFAAGNLNTNSPVASLPGSYFNCLSVAATDHNDKRASFSNYGTWVDISAPGVNVLSTTPTNSYGLKSGTSMSCPHVSGVAALAISKFGGPGFSNHQLWDMLLRGTDNIDEKNPGFSGQLGAGRLNALRVMESGDDGVPPAAIVDLRIDATEVSDVSLAFTASGSSGHIGYAGAYDLRYSTTPIDEDNFYQATQVSVATKPAISGSRELIKIGGLAHTTQYYFAIKASDYSNNISTLSNIVSATTLAPPHIEVEAPSLDVTLDVWTMTTKNIKVTNTGITDLKFEILGTWKSGDPIWDFPAQYYPVRSLEPGLKIVSPGQTVEFPILISAESFYDGTYHFEVSINSNDPVAPTLNFSSTLVAIGIQDIACCYGDVDFGQHYVQTETETQFPLDPLEIINPGSKALHISDIRITEGHFTTKMKTFTVPPGKSSYVSVFFKPTEAKMYSGKLTIVSDDPEEPEITISLSGEGLSRPVITVNPSSIAVTLVKGQNISEKVSISNSGTLDLLWQLDIDRNVSLGDLRDYFSQRYEEVTLAIPNRYDFTEGKVGSKIFDGGDKMFNVGNQLSYYRSSAFPFDYTGGELLADPQLHGEYFSQKYPGLFILVADGIMDQFYVYGALGQNNSRLSNALAFTVQHNGVEYKVFGKRYYGGTTPSVNQLMIVENKPTLRQTFNEYIGNGKYNYNQVIYDDALGSAKRVHYLLYAGANGEYIRDESTKLIAKKFLEACYPASWLVSDLTSGTTIPSSQNEVIVGVSSKDLSIGSYSAIIKIHTNDLLVPEQILPVNLQVVDFPKLSTDKTSIDFDVIEVGQIRQDYINVRNTGGSALHLHELVLPNDAITVSPTNALLAPGAEKIFTVVYSPKDITDHSGNLIFRSDDQANPNFSFLISARAKRKEVLTVSPKNISMVMGQGEVAFISVTVDNSMNNAAHSWQVNNITELGEWLKPEETFGTLEVGEKKAVTIKLDTDGISEGLHTGRLKITSDGNTEDIIVILQISTATNHPPIVALSPSDMSLSVNSNNQSLNLAKLFSDIDRDLLEYFVLVADPLVLSADLSGTLLTFSALTCGQTKVTVSATDGKSNPVIATFMITVVKAMQQIAFSEIIPIRRLDEGDFDLNTSCSSGLPVSLSSSNSKIAVVDDKKIKILGIGEVIITATQSGNETFEAAQPVEKIVTIKKGLQAISFMPFPDKTLGDPDFEAVATTSSSLRIAYHSNNTNVAIVSDNVIDIVGAGMAIITAIQNGDDNYEPALSVMQSLLVEKKSQNISFLTLPEKTLGDVPFTFSAIASSGLPVMYSSSNEDVVTIRNSTATIVGAGEAIITSVQGGDENYRSALHVAQSLMVHKKNQSITFLQISEKLLGEDPFNLTATSSSGLPVIYSSSNTDVISITGSSVKIVGAGEAIITASQDGNVEYNPAISVSNKMLINLVTGIESGFRYAVNIYPNPASEYVLIETIEIGEKSVIKIFDSYGKFVCVPELLAENSIMFKIDVSKMTSGVYYLQINNGKRSITKRIVKK